jgi:hypothetical protein
MASGGQQAEQPGRSRRPGDYWPLLAVVIVAALAAGAMVIGGFGWGKSSSVFPSFQRTLLHAFMGVFLTIFALLKLLDLRGFADCHHRYDLVSRLLGLWWSYLLPMIELGVGLALLAFVEPKISYYAVIALFTVGAVGAATGLKRPDGASGPCMGGLMRLPLATIILAEAVIIVAAALRLLL